MKLWVLNELTLGTTNGSQMRGKNKNNSANALPNVHAPIWLLVFVMPVWEQCPHLTITGLFPKSDLRIPRSQSVASTAVAVTTGVFSSSAGGDDMVDGRGSNHGGIFFVRGWGRQGRYGRRLAALQRRRTQRIKMTRYARKQTQNRRSYYESGNNWQRTS